MNLAASAWTAARRALTVLACAAAAASLLSIALAVWGVRAGRIGWTFAMDRLLGGAAPGLAVVALGAGVVAGASWVAAKAWKPAIAAGVGAAVAAAVLLALGAWRARTADRALATSPVHDVATDWRDPLMPTRALVRRRGARALRIEAAPALGEGPRGGFLGRLVAEENAATCPRAQPLLLPLSPGAAYARLKRAVLAAGLRPVTDDPEAGVLEAEALAPLAWGARADVIARVRAAGDGARIDLRSVSRYGSVDGGTNCRRVVALRAATGA
ncbi:MAG: DUF1499 domain-containing protein [Caulobacteraceae bacterium]|nr:DUF1499 domain-containing protein [Caulobacter sp.]